MNKFKNFFKAIGIIIFLIISIGCFAWFTCQFVYPKLHPIEELTKVSLNDSSLSAIPSTKSINRFDAAFENLMKEEGGYVFDKSDPGGETKYGISKHSYPHLDIKNLTKEDAKIIYRRDYWNKIQGDLLPSEKLASEMLEEAVNMGVHVASSFLQSAILCCGGKIKIDGVIGKDTLIELSKLDNAVLLKCIQSQAITYYLMLVRENPVLRKFIKSWFNRVLT